MSPVRALSALCAATFALTLATGAAAAAEPAGVQPNIIDGEQAEQVPWGAQVYVNTSGRPWDGFNCSGSIIAKDWVLTAQHCLDEDGSGMRVKVGSNTLGQGTEATVDKKEVSPNGDIALLHLAKPIETTYLTLGDSDPSSGENTIYGWGRETPTGPPANELKKATVKVTGTSTDAFGGRAIQSTGVNGAAWKGDSGGPQVADGKQVGVASTVLNDGTDPNGTNNYASVAASRDWIKSTAGV
ncbi:S1 family peptidase [Amycolatopsis anabasis]|uniref:S1 family peptidase n=1 Tax=Amycolatopsis anabasis TaxID=1840409 RepID=UPI00131C354F|nr:trypsin-like serine protease [Amycolatopsis anabasis]